MKAKKICVMSLIVLAVVIVVGCVCYYTKNTKQVFEGTFISIDKLNGGLYGKR
ncbi:hypothetical protein [Lachnoclostridium sp.]|uniref:hypothetical protein n=1 Tax=Lachnoclostridium sp. TaxID=2028282 RepID=UPI0026B9DE07|nr:hypothetical protein [Lachnoclostridium sp.]